MVKFVIATHGNLAEGFKSALSIIMGQKTAEKITTINAFIEDGSMNPKEDLSALVNDLKENEQLVVFTDIMHGSVNQFLMPLINDKNIFVISGINFPVLCEIIAKYTFGELQTVNIMDLKLTIEKAKEEIIFVNSYMETVNEINSDDSFFE